MTIDVRFEQEAVWLTHKQIAELFGKERSVITKHILNVFIEQELDKKTMCRICPLQILISQWRFIALK